MMTQWVRFLHDGAEHLGSLSGDVITLCTGDLFDGPQPTGRRLPLAAVRVLAPVRPGKMVAIWNNLRTAAAKHGWDAPAEPLYVLKPSTCCIGQGETIRRPAGYDGRIVFEGELGVVIGRRCNAVSEAEAADHIFGFTCVNDVTALQLIDADPSFAQWTRAKGFDTFGVLGPVVATGLDPATLNVRTTLNGRERQNYPVADMFFGPAALVSHLSRNMTLEPGDVIACGTSLGVAPMKTGQVVEVTIDGIGSLSNPFE
jgi:2-keto-4-pentenoate hydratase/2-oxohepta-3-ene-1,7-dioic acid hydratase in catechol pathway